MREYTKRCARCQTEKPIEAYYKRTNSADGRGSYCKDCSKTYNKNWKAIRPEKGRASAAAWQSANPEVYKNNQAAYRAANMEHIKTQQAGYYAAHRKSIMARIYKWKKENPEKVKKMQHEHAYRRRVRLLGGFVEAVDVTVLMERDEGRCGICFGPVPDGKARGQASVDHIIPISKGGEHSYANTQVTHLRCNVARGARELSLVRPADA